MGITRKVRQAGTQCQLGCTVFHTRNVLHVPLAFHIPQGREHRHAVAVGHALLNVRDVLVRQHVVGGHDIGQVKQISQNRIDVVCA